jgi:hypothetical protein
MIKIKSPERAEEIMLTDHGMIMACGYSCGEWFKACWAISSTWLGAVRVLSPLIDVSSHLLPHLVC